MNLSNIKIGESVKVVKVHATSDKCIRMIEMGLTPGATVTLNRKAPLGDPIEIELRGYKICMRKQDAKLVEVIKTEETEDVKEIQ